MSETEEGKVDSETKSTLATSQKLIIMTTINLSLNCPPPFIYSEETRNSAGSRWPRWIKDFELYMTGVNLVEAKQQKAVLLHVAGEAVRDIYYADESTADGYDEVKEKLNKHFNPMKHIDFHIFQFGEIKQYEDESMSDFVVRLRKAAVLCEFKTATDSEIKRQIIRGCKSKALKENILMKASITLTEIMEQALTSETVRQGKHNTRWW